MLHTLKPAKGSRKARTRPGRGSGAGRGTTAGRGTKGQGSRSGKGTRLRFEGGQTPLLQRQPKLAGFKNPNRTEYEILNLDIIESALDAGSYDIAALRSTRLLSTKRPVKLLGRGELKKKFTLEVNAVSKSAKEAVEKAGGTVTVIKR